MKGQNFTKPHKTLAVRGPRTRAAFLRQGYECPPVYGDPALLMPLIYKPTGNLQDSIGIVPHYVDKDIAKKLFENDNTYKLINVFDSIEKVIDDITSCKFVLSSSLHGLIISHAYRIPCAWLKLSDDLWGDDTKFHDHFESIEIGDANYLDLSQIDIRNANEIERLVNLYPQPSKATIDCVVRGLIESCPYNLALAFENE